MTGEAEGEKGEQEPLRAAAPPSSLERNAIASLGPAIVNAISPLSDSACSSDRVRSIDGKIERGMQSTEGELGMLVNPS